MKLLAVLLIYLQAFALTAQVATYSVNTGTTLQTGVKPISLNIDYSNYGVGQIIKNVANANPGCSIGQYNYIVQVANSNLSNTEAPNQFGSNVTSSQTFWPLATPTDGTYPSSGFAMSRNPSGVPEIASFSGLTSGTTNMTVTRAQGGTTAQTFTLSQDVAGVAFGPGYTNQFQNIYTGSSVAANQLAGGTARVLYASSPLITQGAVFSISSHTAGPNEVYSLGSSAAGPIMPGDNFIMSAPVTEAQWTAAEPNQGYYFPGWYSSTGVVTFETSDLPPAGTDPTGTQAVSACVMTAPSGGVDVNTGWEFGPTGPNRVLFGTGKPFTVGLWVKSVSGSTTLVSAVQDAASQAGQSGAAWSSGTTYPYGVSVQSGGVQYMSIQGGNVGNMPSSSPSFWQTGNSYFAQNQCTISASAWTYCTYQVSDTETKSTPFNYSRFHLSLSASQVVKVTDLSIQATNIETDNDTILRDEQLDLLTTNKPGGIRFMMNACNTQSMANILAPFVARYINVTSPTYPSTNPLCFGPYDVFKIANRLQIRNGARVDPWVTIPVSATAAEMVILQDYTSAPCSKGSTGTILRCTQDGQTEPWSQVFTQIHYEFGNENWNGQNAYRTGMYKSQMLGLFGNYNLQPYAVQSQYMAAAAKGDPQYASNVKYSMGLQLGDNTPQFDANLCPDCDAVNQAPYSGTTVVAYSPASTTTALSSMAEAEFNSSLTDNSFLYLTWNAYHSAFGINKYEYNCNLGQGSITQQYANGYCNGNVYGEANVLEASLDLQNFGTNTQNIFTLNEGDFGWNNTSSQPIDSYTWGMTVMNDSIWGNPIVRPSFLHQQAVNGCMTGRSTAFQVAGSNVQTWNYTQNGNGAVNVPNLSGLPVTRAFGYWDGSSNACVLLYNETASAALVNFTGANPPSGNVQKTVVTSANPGDNNELYFVKGLSIAGGTETATAVNPTGLVAGNTTTFSSTPDAALNSAGPVTVISASTGSAPYTFTFATSEGNATYGSGGTYAIGGVNPVTIATTSLTGFNPSTSFSVPGFSTVALSYTIGIPQASAPTYSPVANTYTSPQSVTLSSTTPSPVITYCVISSGSCTPMTTYTVPISVASSETIYSFTNASGYTQSTTSSAAYVINLTPGQVVMTGNVSATGSVTIQ